MGAERRLRQAGALTTSMTELLRRIAADLHDGPRKTWPLALLTVDERWSDAASAPKPAGGAPARKSAACHVHAAQHRRRPGGASMARCRCEWSGVRSARFAKSGWSIDTQVDREEAPEVRSRPTA
jgi:hypothetical protein